jgi:hypothetical protein
MVTLDRQLGLTPAAMLALRWQVAADEVGEQRTEKAAPAGSSTVDGGRSGGERVKRTSTTPARPGGIRSGMAPVAIDGTRK